MSCRSSLSASGTGPTTDVNATFVQTTRWKWIVNENMGIQLFAGDMYMWEQNCSLIVSSK